jgi:hypothetical protein
LSIIQGLIFCPNTFPPKRRFIKWRLGRDGEAEPALRHAAHVRNVGEGDDAAGWGRILIRRIRRFLLEQVDGARIEPPKILAPVSENFTSGRDNFTSGRKNFTSGRENFTSGRDNFTSGREFAQMGPRSLMPVGVFLNQKSRFG